MSLTTIQSGGTRQEALRAWVKAVMLDIRDKLEPREIRVHVALDALHPCIIYDGKGGEEFAIATVSIAFVERVREAYGPIDHLSKAIQELLAWAIEDANQSPNNERGKS